MQRVLRATCLASIMSLALTCGSDASQTVCMLPMTDDHTIPIVASNYDPVTHYSCTVYYTVTVPAPGGVNNQSYLSLTVMALPPGAANQVVGTYDTAAYPGSTIGSMSISCP